MCFSFVRAQIDRGSQKWENIREKRAASGRIGGVASGESRKQNKATKQVLLLSSKTKQTKL
jgi:hypothetical protein